MKIRCIEKIDKEKYNPKTYPLYFGDLIVGGVYEVLSTENGWYRIIDESDYEHGYLYPPDIFAIVEKDPSAP